MELKKHENLCPIVQVLGASLFSITAHAAFYNYDALEVPEDQEQLVGAIVEEV